MRILSLVFVAGLAALLLPPAPDGIGQGKFKGQAKVVQPGGKPHVPPTPSAHPTPVVVKPAPVVVKPAPVVVQPVQPIVKFPTHPTVVKPIQPVIVQQPKVIVAPQPGK